MADITITQEMASDIIAHRNWEDNRKLREYQIRNIIIALQHGKMAKDAIHFCRYRGIDYMIDGQHRMHAIIRSGIPFTFSAIIHVVNSRSEIGQIYNALSLDVPKSSYDRVRALETDFDLEPSEMHALSSSSRMIATGFRQTKSRTELKRFIQNESFKFNMLRQEYSVGVIEYFRILRTFPPSGEAKKRFLRAGVCSVALVTIQEIPSKAISFWEETVADQGLEHGTAQKTLSDFLIAHSVRIRSYGTLEYAGYVVNAWNKYMSMEPVRKLRSSPIPLSIEGTSFDGEDNPNYMSDEMYNRYI